MLNSSAKVPNDTLSNISDRLYGMDVMGEVPRFALVMMAIPKVIVIRPAKKMQYLRAGRSFVSPTPSVPGTGDGVGYLRDLGRAQVLDPVVQIGDVHARLHEPRGLEGRSDLLPAVVEGHLGYLEEELLIDDVEGGLPGGDPHEGGVDLWFGVEARCGNGLHDLAVGAVEQAHGEAGVVGAADVRDHAVRELLLHHYDGGPEAAVQELEDYRGGDAVRQVAHEDVELRERDLDGIAVDQLQAVPVGL